MRKSLFFLIFVAIFVTHLQFRAESAPTGPLIKHLSSFLKWKKSSSPRTSQTDENIVQFENGYLVETVVEGNELGVVPHSIRVSKDGELFAIDAANSNIVRITPPLSHYSRARLIAGSFQGYSGHVDGKPADARFNHPKGVTMDDKGNVYVADTSNLAIRKIGEAGVTTIAGGKSNIAGYRDGPSEDAKFSTDFDVMYDGRTCSLLVIDRGNAALRQISLHEEDCEYQYSSISPTDIVMVIGAVLVGYASCMLQQGFGPSIFSKTPQISESEFQDEPITEKPPTLLVESLKEDPDAGWPSFGRLVIDLSKLAIEALGSILLYFIPRGVRFSKPQKDLTPLRDTLLMPEDKAEPPLVQKQRNPTPLSEPRHVSTSNGGENYALTRHQRSKSVSMKDPSLISKHRSSKRQDFTEFYGSSEGVAPPPYGQFSSKSQKDVAPPPYGQFSSKSQKDRTRHRHRERNPDAGFGGVGTEPAKAVEMKSGDYGDPKFDHYNFRSKSFHF